MKLSDLKQNQRAKVIKVDKSLESLKKRLSDMGFVKNQEIEIKRIAPLGDPIEISVKGYSLSLRKKEAEKIEVETI
jgi:ferrous iron transport protein A